VLVDPPTGETETLDVLALEEALEELANINKRKARVVEMKFFAGMSGADIAAELEISERQVVADWAFARSWLHRRLHAEDS
jgi:DNA-directed RNA polymerase specialized sigma24 family protein